MKKYKWQIITGVCKCGHSYDEHHLGIILNEDVMKELPEGHPPYVPQECEFFGCNEYGGLDDNGNDHCHQYEEIDK